MISFVHEDKAVKHLQEAGQQMKGIMFEAVKSHSFNNVIMFSSKCIQLKSTFVVS